MNWFFPIHYFLHLIFPGVVAYAATPKLPHKWWKVYMVLLATMIIDLDHLLATPIFDPNRCSIGFHPLHSPIAIGVYVLMIFIPNFWVRVIATGLIWHILVDLLDCMI